jgi:hypothetical protein
MLMTERRPMIHPIDSQPVWPLQKLDVASGPVTCAACGCRLEADSAVSPSSWTHFGPMAGRDARGCRVECVDLSHDATGRALVALTA